MPATVNVTTEIKTVNYSKGSLEVSDSDVAKVVTALRDKAGITITNAELKPKLEILKSAAKSFSDRYNWIAIHIQQLTDCYQHIQQLELQNKRIAKIKQVTAEDYGELNTLIQDYNLTVDKIVTLNTLHDVFQQFYSSVLMFNKALNNFFGIHSVLTIVTDKGKLYDISIDDYSQYLTYEINDKGNIVGRFYQLGALIKQSQDINNAVTDILQANKYDPIVLDRVQHGRNSAIWRFQKSHAVINQYNKRNYEGHTKDSPYHGGLVLWNRPNWHGLFVSSVGDINEAYAAFIFDRQQLDNFFPSGNIDIILETFMKAVANVDSVSGMFRGDVITNEIEHAVKSNKATAIRYDQFIDIANMVLQNNIDTQLVDEYIEDRMTDKGKRGEIKNNIQDEIESALFNSIVEASVDTDPY